MVSLDGHTFIAGVTSSGKTTLAKRVFKESRRKCLFLNAQAENVPGAKETRNIPRLAELWKNGKVAWTQDPFVMAKQLPDLVGKLFDFGEAVGDAAGGIDVNRSKPWLNVFADEAHLLAPNGAAPGGLERLATQGLRYGIVLVSITQRPQLCSKTVLSQSPQVVLFRVTQPDREYLENKLHPIGAQEWAWAQQRYHYLILNPAEHEGWTMKPPMGRP